MHIPLPYPIYWPFPVSQPNKTSKPNARCAQMFKQLNMNLHAIFFKTQIPTVTLAKTMNVHALKKFSPWFKNPHSQLGITMGKQNSCWPRFLQSPTGTCAPCLLLSRALKRQNIRALLTISN